MSEAAEERDKVLAAVYRCMDGPILLDMGLL
jgi:hypothetical protein